MKTWQVNILTLFPEMFPGSLGYSLAGKALEKKLFSLNLIDIRNYATGKYKTVDDKIFGGGAGMLMKPDVVGAAIDDVIANYSPKKLIYFTPRGKLFNQSIANQLIKNDSLLMLCGRYEGVDQRIFEKYEFDEYSVGDYILSGGEIAALTVLDACVRLISGVIQNSEAHKEESFSSEEDKNLLEYDQYTRPAIWEGRKVPEVLISGNHAEIAKWRIENAVANTKRRRY